MQQTIAAPYWRLLREVGCNGWASYQMSHKAGTRCWTGCFTRPWQSALSAHSCTALLQLSLRNRCRCQCSINLSCPPRKPSNKAPPNRAAENSKWHNREFFGERMTCFLAKKKKKKRNLVGVCLAHWKHTIEGLGFGTQLLKYCRGFMKFFSLSLGADMFTLKQGLLLLVFVKKNLSSVKL